MTIVDTGYVEIRYKRIYTYINVDEIMCLSLFVSLYVCYTFQNGWINPNNTFWMVVMIEAQGIEAYKMFAKLTLYSPSKGLLSRHLNCLHSHYTPSFNEN